MDWLQTNWTLITLAWGKSAFLSVVINPLGISISVALVILGYFWVNMRKYLYLALFSVWALAPLHHYTMEGRQFEHTDFGGYGGLSGFASGALFFGGVIAVAIVIIYFVMMRD